MTVRLGRLHRLFEHHFFLCLFLFFFFLKDFRQTLGIDSSHFKEPLLGWSSQGCTRPLDPTVIERSLGGGGGDGRSSLSDGIALNPPTPTTAADGYHARLRPTGDICPDQAAVLILSAQITAPPPSPLHHAFLPSPCHLPSPGLAGSSEVK